MVVVKLMNFGGMIPAVDDRLLPKDHASNSENTWLYTGALEGMYELQSVHTLVDPFARKVYRIPFDSYDKDRIVDSYWMEFSEVDVDVLKTPLTDDTFERFYICGSGTPPSYNTRARIINGDPNYVLGIPGPETAPIITREAGRYYLSAAMGAFSLLGRPAKLYYSAAYAVDGDSFGSGGVDDNTAPYAGATRPVHSVKGNVDQSPAPPTITIPANLIRVLGQAAELRYTTAVAGRQITVSDSGTITAGLPSLPAAASVSPEYEGVGVLEYRAYTYTWVSSFGEEGPPAPPGVYIGYSGDLWVIKLTAPTAGDLLDRDLDTVRIYRTITGVEGSTSYFLVAELPIATTSYTDNISTVTVASNTQLQSTFWTAPPVDLEGIVLLANGIMAGWRNNEIWFSEPYRPHAWPAPYVLTVEYPIVGLGVMGQSAIICTPNSTHIASGVNPATITMNRIPGLQPCASRGSILTTPRGVVYASLEGIVLVTPGELQVVTRSIIDSDEWLDPNFLVPLTLRSSTVGAAYYTWGSVRSGCFDEETFNPDAFLQTDFTGAYIGALIDIENNRIAYNKLTSVDPVFNCFADVWSGETLVIRDGQVMHLNRAPGVAREPFVWRSKVMETPNQRNFGAMRIYFSDYTFSPELNPVRNTDQAQVLAADQWGIMRLYADGRLVVVREIRTSGEIFKLPSGFKATFWEVEIEARISVYSVELATTSKELMLA
jgi:hypothetical protein